MRREGKRDKGTKGGERRGREWGREAEEESLRDAR